MAKSGKKWWMSILSGLFLGTNVSADPLPQISPITAPSLEPQAPNVPLSIANPAVVEMFTKAILSNKGNKELRELRLFSQRNRIQPKAPQGFHEKILEFIKASDLESDIEREESEPKKIQLSLFIKSLQMANPETKAFLDSLHDQLKSETAKTPQAFVKVFVKGLETHTFACNKTLEARNDRLSNSCDVSITDFAIDYTQNELKWFKPTANIAVVLFKDKAMTQYAINQGSYLLHFQIVQLMDVISAREAALKINASPDIRAYPSLTEGEKIAEIIFHAGQDNVIVSSLRKKITNFSKQAVEQSAFSTSFKARMNLDPIISDALIKASQAIEDGKKPQAPVQPTLPLPAASRTQARFLPSQKPIPLAVQISPLQLTI